MCVCSDDIAIMYIDLLLYLTILSLLTIFVEMSTYNLDSPIFTCDPKYFSTFKFNHANKIIRARVNKIAYQKFDYYLRPLR